MLTSIDLAPTFLDIASVDRTDDMDGMSLLPRLHSNVQTGAHDRKYILIEHQGEHNTRIPGCPQYDGQNMAVRVFIVRILNRVSCI